MINQNYYPGQQKYINNVIEGTYAIDDSINSAKSKANLEHFATEEGVIKSQTEANMSSFDVDGSKSGEYTEIGKSGTEGAGNYDSLVEKAKNVDVSTTAHQAVFYSGKGNRARAEAFAELNGKTTLEMTPGGKYFDSLKLFEDGSPVAKDQAYEIWKILSERYAKAASGNAYGFVKGSFPESIFNTVEYPALQKNPYITNIYTELFN